MGERGDSPLQAKLASALAAILTVAHLCRTRLKSGEALELTCLNVSAFPKGRFSASSCLI